MRLQRVSVIELKCLNYPFGNLFNTKYLLYIEELSHRCGIQWIQKCGAGVAISGPDMAKFCHYGQIFKALGNFLRVYLQFVKILDQLWQNFESHWASFHCPNVEKI